MSRRPPFENRWTNGRKAWRWYRALEALGVENARTRLAHQDSLKPARFPDPDIPMGFVQDWLSYHDRKDRRVMLLGRVAAVLVIGVGVIAVVLGLRPVF
ncbi:MAG TPA: hypothetical protein VGI79_06880 [Caulobacteraceae bacterium]